VLWTVSELKVEPPQPAKVVTSLREAWGRPAVAASVNHRAPSGPAAMLPGKAPAVGVGNSVKVSASACSAMPTAAHNETIAMRSKRRYRFCMYSPSLPDTLRKGLRQMFPRCPAVRRPT
jgi:hypothetical protein